MNSVTAKISSIQTSGSLSLVSLEAGLNKLSAILIDTPETLPFLKVGNTVKAIFKETEVAIGLSKTDSLSMRNQLPGVIKEINESELLSKVVLQIETGDISSIITTKAVHSLDLKVGIDAVAFIKTNEIMLSE